MEHLYLAQKLQLRLIESASINESCAIDLMSVLRKLTLAEASCVVGIINLLNNEAAFLRALSKDIDCYRVEVALR